MSFVQRPHQSQDLHAVQHYEAGKQVVNQGLGSLECVHPCSSES